MDGTGRSIIINSTTFGDPTGISLDYSTQTLYWINSHVGIECSNVDGSNRRVLVSNTAHGPYAIEFFKGNLYFVTNNGMIGSISVMRPNSSLISYSFPHCQTIYDIKVISEEQQLLGITLTKQSHLAMCNHDHSNQSLW